MTFLARRGPHDGSDPWHCRILLTLNEAQCSLTLRQLRIRCGVTTRQQDARMRTTLRRLKQQRSLTQVRRGVFTLSLDPTEERIQP